MSSQILIQLFLLCLLVFEVLLYLIFVVLQVDVNFFFDRALKSEQSLRLLIRLVILFPFYYTFNVFEFSRVAHVGVLRVAGASHHLVVVALELRGLNLLLSLSIRQGLLLLLDGILCIILWCVDQVEIDGAIILIIGVVEVLMDELGVGVRRLLPISPLVGSWHLRIRFSIILFRASIINLERDCIIKLKTASHTLAHILTNLVMLN